MDKSALRALDKGRGMHDPDKPGVAEWLLANYKIHDYPAGRENPFPIVAVNRPFQKSTLSLFYGIRTACPSRLSMSDARARASCSLTFAPWMKKTFAFSPRTASGGRTAANARRNPARRRKICRELMTVAAAR